MGTPPPSPRACAPRPTLFAIARPCTGGLWPGASPDPARPVAPGLPGRAATSEDGLPGGPAVQSIRGIRGRPVCWTSAAVDRSRSSIVIDIPGTQKHQQREPGPVVAVEDDKRTDDEHPAWCSAEHESIRLPQALRVAVDV